MINYRVRPVIYFLFVVALLLLVHSSAAAQARRLVVIKLDGLPFRLVDRVVRETDPRTGKSSLPWTDRLFYQGGTRMTSFYTRGLSLSGPSWSMLDTGQHLQIKGNVEFDRLTLYSYDYLNFLPYYVDAAFGRRLDSQSAEMFDDLGLKMLVDFYPEAERYQSFQLNQRGVRWRTLESAFPNLIKSLTPKELFDEWVIGMNPRSIPLNQMERDIIQLLGEPKIRYLDYFTTEFDHNAHHNRDHASHVSALQDLDALLGRIWTAIERSPLADDTLMIVVSDHGINTDEKVFSQGYSLVELLRSAAGGGHHVLTKRRVLMPYSVKSIYPFTPLIATQAKESFYLKGQTEKYPTAVLDFDGNERASIHLRDSDFNLLHILLQQIKRKDLKAEVRRAAIDAFFTTLNRRREGWKRLVTEMTEELEALARRIEKEKALAAELEKKKDDPQTGKQLGRVNGHINTWRAREQDYRRYIRILTNLVSLPREGFDLARAKIEDLIPPRAMGDANTIHSLQNYVVGLASGGLARASDGSLDLEKSFRRVDYFELFSRLQVRNNVQRGVSNRPIDFLAVRIPREALSEALGEEEMPDTGAVWAHTDRDHQALILARHSAEGELSLRYLPVSDLKMLADGKVKFERASWQPGLPLKMWEDERLNTGGADRREWLSAWRTELEWFRAVHKTEYSNGIIGLHEGLTRHPVESCDPTSPGLSEDEKVLRRLRLRERHLAEADLWVIAGDHWNFDVRGFNPGGNHGSFLRVSTHSTLMFTGGARAGIPRGMVIEEPYDSLSFFPTVLKLTGQLKPEDQARYPGRIIKELFETEPANHTTSSDKAAKTSR